MEQQNKNNKYILDSHCHIYPEKIAARAVEAIGAFYDLHMEQDGTVGDLIDAGSRCGITHFLVHSVSTTPHQVKSINDFISSEVKKHPERLVGFGTLHPDSEDIEGDVEYLLNLGLHGVKLHPDFQKFAIDSPRSVEMCRLFAGKVPLLMHAGDPRYDYSNPDNILRFLDKVPDITLIAAHFGGWNNWREALSKLTGIDNLYVDCSSSFYNMTKEEAAGAIEAFGADHVLFGSDYPMWSPGGELNILESLGLTPKQLRMIEWENGARLLNLETDTEEKEKD